MDPVKVMFNRYLTQGNVTEAVYMIQNGFSKIGHEELKTLEKHGYSLQFVPKTERVVPLVASGCCTAGYIPEAMTFSTLPLVASGCCTSICTPEARIASTPPESSAESKIFSIAGLAICETSYPLFAEIISGSLPNHNAVLAYLKRNNCAFAQVYSRAIKTNNVALVKILYNLHEVIPPEFTHSAYSELAVNSNALEVCKFFDEQKLKFDPYMFANITGLSLPLLIWALNRYPSPIDPYKALELSIIDGNFEKVKQIIILSRPVFNADNSPLPLLADLSRYDMAEYLLSQGVPMGPALDTAIQVGDGYMVELLLKHGATLGEREFKSIIMCPDVAIINLVNKYLELREEKAAQQARNDQCVEINKLKCVDVK